MPEASRIHASTHLCTEVLSDEIKLVVRVCQVMAVEPNGLRFLGGFKGLYLTPNALTYIGGRMAGVLTTKAGRRLFRPNNGVNARIHAIDTHIYLTYYVRKSNKFMDPPTRRGG